MPTASIICSPAFATSAASTATIYYTHNFQKGIVSNSNPYQNSSYVAFSPGIVNYNNKTIYNSIAPIYNGFSGISNSSACTINNITISFFGALPSTSFKVPENFKILCYNSTGTKKIEFSVPGAPTSTNTSAIDGTAITTSSAQITRIITGTFNSSDFLNQDNFYKIEFYVPQNTSNNSGFILRGNHSGVDYKLTITIDYTEPPKPSFTNAPVLKVNNSTTSSVDNTAVLTWTQASLDSNFSSLQSSVKYEIWVNDSKYSDAGTNLTFTYLEQPSSRKVIKVRAYLVSSGVTYYSNYSNAVYYTYIPSGYVATKVIDDGWALDPNWTGETDPNLQSIVYYFYSGETLWVNPKSDLVGGYNIYHLAYNSSGQVGYVSLYYLDWALNTLKYYDNGWKDCYIYYYNGSNWIPCVAYYYTGTEWKQCQ